MHQMQPVITKHSPMHHTLTPHVPLILPVSVISAKQKPKTSNTAFMSWQKNWFLIKNYCHVKTPNWELLDVVCPHLPSELTSCVSYLSLWLECSIGQIFWALTPLLIGWYSLPPSPLSSPLIVLFSLPLPPPPLLHAHERGRVFLFGQVSLQAWDQKVQDLLIRLKDVS